MIKLCKACQKSHEVTIQVEYDLAAGPTESSLIPIIFKYSCPEKYKKMQVKFYFNVEESKIFKGARIIEIK